LLAFLLVGGLVACASASGAIPVDQFKDDAPSATSEYLISIGDLISIQVWDQPQMSGRMRVRSDGRISLPFVNELQAAGKTPSGLATELEAGLKAVVIAPRVTVAVEESKPLTISVLGEVARPGPQVLDEQTGVAHALAAAGGLTTFAHKDRIFVVRTSPKPLRIHFTYDALTRGLGAAASFRLRPGDVIVVE
jgi:polysaccharide export outer membrane protein